MEPTEITLRRKTATVDFGLEDLPWSLIQGLYQTTHLSNRAATFSIAVANLKHPTIKFKKLKN